MEEKKIVLPLFASIKILKQLKYFKKEKLGYIHMMKYSITFKIAFQPGAVAPPIIPVVWETEAGSSKSA